MLPIPSHFELSMHMHHKAEPPGKFAERLFSVSILRFFLFSKATRRKETVMEKKKKAALYTRVSTVHQVDKDSLPHQKHALTEYIKYVLHIEAYEIFEDAGFSGKNTNRPAYQEMMTRIRAGEFTHLVVNKIDRISRNLLDFAAMYEELKKYNVVFVSCNEQFDTSNAMGEAMLKIILVFAELERHMTSERVTAVMVDRARKGKWNGTAHLPLGYVWEKDSETLIIKEDEAKIVRAAYAKALQGISCQGISRYLNQHGAKTRRGKYWTPSGVSRILTNPIYKGTMRYNYRNSAKKQVKNPSEWIIQENHHVGIVTVEEWERTQELLVARRPKVGNELKGKYIHVFSNLMYCLCGYRETCDADNKHKGEPYQPSFYRCSNHKERQGAEDSCDNNKSISDRTIGTFVITYMQNMIRLRRKCRTEKLSMEAMEKELLYNYPFRDIKGIESQSMKAIYASFMYGADVDYHRSEEKEIELDDAALEEFIKTKKSHERALERLTHAYLYDDGGISEKAYLKERKRIQSEIEAVSKKIKSLSSGEEASRRDYAFFDQVGDYLIREQLLSTATVDWDEFASHVKNKNLQEFFRTVIYRIVTYQGKILSIEFKNGVQHRFIYREEN